MSGHLTAPARTALRRRLLAWYDQEQRDLPWRHTDDPYRILLSELLLQQTRVEAARPYYEKFVEAFPTVHDLAAAPLDRVLNLWAGLGYYRRARNLHKAAGEVVEQFAGRVPGDAAQLLTLPGVGRYTAAAVASIAFGQPVAALDGNIKRVLARLHALPGPLDERETEQQLWALAEDLLARRRPGDFNQAMMEIGATVCLPKQPRCLVCPLQRWCRASAEGKTDDIPARKPKAARPHVEAVAAVVFRGDRLLMVQRPEQGLLAGMWELPGGPREAEEEAQLAVVRIGRQRFGVELTPGDILGDISHVFTHRTTRITVVTASIKGRLKTPDHADSGWFDPTARRDVPIATLDKKVLRLVSKA